MFYVIYFFVWFVNYFGFEDIVSNCNMWIYFRRSGSEVFFFFVYVWGESGEIDVFIDEEVWFVVIRNLEF